jgi:hypothetical protein
MPIGACLSLWTHSPSSGGLAAERIGGIESMVGWNV